MWTFIWIICTIIAIISAIMYKESKKTYLQVIGLSMLYLSVALMVTAIDRTSGVTYNTNKYLYKIETKTIIKNDSIIKSDTFHLIVPIKKNK